jgi:hypothetical protein
VTAPNKAKPACAVDPDTFFPASYTPKLTAESKRLCRSCTVRRACLEQVAGDPQDEGVYAAMAPKEREGLADLLAAAGGDSARVLRLFDDREALVSAQRIWRHGITRDVAEQIVGVADLERARLVRRHTPDLVDAVLVGAVTLRDAAVQASIVADFPKVAEAA